MKQVRSYHPNAGQTIVFLRFFLALFFLNTQQLVHADNEPNNSFANAEVISLNTPQTGYLDNNDDMDFYEINVSEDGTLYVSDTNDNTLNYYIRIYEADQVTQIHYVYRYSDGSGSHISMGLLPGTYYIVFDKSSSSDAGSYSFNFKYTPTSLTGDSEPNDSSEIANSLTLNTVNTGNLGHRKTGLYDKNDWWKLTITEDGTLTVHDSIESPMTYYIKLYEQDGETLIRREYRYADNSGSRIKLGVLPGTYYLELDRNSSDYSTFGSYTILPEFVPVNQPSDTENNDSSQVANTMVLNSVNSGNLGHRSIGFYDDKDWWEVTISEDGVLFLHDSTETPMTYYIKLYDQDAETLVKSEFRYSDNSGSRINLGVLPGTYYLELDKNSAHYTTFGSYTIFPEFTPSTYIDDENNDSIHLSNNFYLDSINVGNLGYRKTGHFDKIDWWQITMEKEGRLTLLDSTEQPLTYYINLHDADTNSLARKYRYPDNSGSRISVDVAPGNYYLSLDRYSSDYSTHGSYSVQTSFIPKPVSDFIINQNISSISLSNQSEHGETYLWDFGNGETSELVNPSYTYSEPGDYKISLIAYNAYSSDTSSQVISLYGIRDFSPKTGGNTGMVTLTILGGGLSDSSIVKLKKQGTEDIEAISVTLSDIGAIQATFDLHSADIGLYDLEVTNPEHSPIVNSAAFTVEMGEAPQPWVNLSGRTRALLNRWQTYTIEFGNTGNVDAEIVPIIITVSNPDENEIYFPDLEIVHVDLVYENGWEAIFDTVPYYFDLDTFQGDPVKTRVFPLYFDNIPAGYSGSFKMKIKTSDNVTVNVWNTEPLMFNGELKSCADANSKLAECLYWAKLQAGADVAFNWINLAIPGSNCIYSVGKSAYSLTTGIMKVREERMKDYAKSKSLFSYMGTLVEGAASLFLNCVGDLTMIGKAYEFAIALTSTAQFMSGVYQADKQCRDLYGMQNRTRYNIRGVTSFDPNEIVGPVGYTNQNYISGNETAMYTIFFENKDTAQAPAQEIWITDTLDKSVFDLSNFSFTSLTVADTTISIPFGQTSFAYDIDFRPKQNIIGRCVGNIDTTAGIIHVYFNTLDAETLDQNEDPAYGILPPNVEKPEGEGCVSFSVGLKELEHNSKFSNKASIVFDFNKPIVTNEWINTIDLESPSSEITSYSINTENNTVELQLEGTDAGAGLESYSIFVSINDSSYISLESTNSDSYIYTLPDNAHSYKFFSLATDSLGHIEETPETADIEFSITDIENIAIERTVLLYPNPAKNEIRLESYSSLIKKAEIHSIDGKLMLSKRLNRVNATMNVSNLNGGLYFVKIKTEDGSITKKILIE